MIYLFFLVFPGCGVEMCGPLERCLNVNGIFINEQSPHQTDGEIVREEGFTSCVLVSIT